jgi:hypothetical protein
MTKGVTPNPWIWEAGDYLYDPGVNPDDHVIRITVTWDSSTRALTGATLFRAADCVYTHIYIGTGPDGAPDSSSRQFTVPAGTVARSAAQLAAVGLSTIDDILSLQITAGP